MMRKCEATAGQVERENDRVQLITHSVNVIKWFIVLEARGQHGGFASSLSLSLSAVENILQLIQNLYFAAKKRDPKIALTRRLDVLTYLFCNLSHAKVYRITRTCDRRIYPRANSLPRGNSIVLPASIVAYTSRATYRQRFVRSNGKKHAVLWQLTETIEVTTLSYNPSRCA